MTIINTVVTSKGILPKSADNKFVQGRVKGKYPRNIKFLTACKHCYVTCTPQKPWLPKNQPEGREGLSRTRIPGRGDLGHSDGWQDTEGDHTHPAIHFPIQQEPQTGGLETHG
ncbi:hypothetical protein O181_043728 [Austropuccinia psidii MF-1]|uniref:Uncharacterized protein n=1 Tax=Austropuccinia psidii MF-1 TaxID=1389203 RepID=A0A9Q3DNQ8_9BASI|nr:hypothetical protein [Austropuccinia psidii MF-1]